MDRVSAAVTVFVKSSSSLGFFSDPFLCSLSPVVSYRSSKSLLRPLVAAFAFSSRFKQDSGVFLCVFVTVNLRCTAVVTLPIGSVTQLFS